MESWRPGAEFGGTEKFFADQDFSITFFSEQISIFTPKNSDDRIFTVLNVVYDPFFIRKTTVSEKNSLTRHLFLLCSYFRAHPTTLLLKILGGRMHGPSPTSNLGGRPPQSR